MIRWRQKLPKNLISHCPATAQKRMMIFFKMNFEDEKKDSSGSMQGKLLVTVEALNMTH